MTIQVLPISAMSTCCPPVLVNLWGRWKTALILAKKPKRRNRLGNYVWKQITEDRKGDFLCITYRVYHTKYRIELTAVLHVKGKSRRNNVRLRLLVQMLQIFSSERRRRSVVSIFWIAAAHESQESTEHSSTEPRTPVHFRNFSHTFTISTKKVSSFGNNCQASLNAMTKNMQTFSASAGNQIDAVETCKLFDN